jgi:ketosteroid isomerase-like protein
MTFDEVSRVITPELAYLLEIERTEAELAATGETRRVSLRVTTIFRREGAQWTIVHRHADPLVAARSVTAIADNLR